MSPFDSSLSVGRREYVRAITAAAGGMLVAGCLGAQGEVGNLPDTFERSEYPQKLAVGEPKLDEGWAVLVSSEEEADELFTVENLNEEYQDNAGKFIDETKFDEQLLIYLEYWVPQPDYALEIDGVAEDDDSIHLELVSEHFDVDGEVSNAPITRRILLRYTFDQTPPDVVQVTYRSAYDGETHDAVAAEEFEGQ